MQRYPTGANSLTRVGARIGVDRTPRRSLVRGPGWGTCLPRTVRSDHLPTPITGEPGGDCFGTKSGSWGEYTIPRNLVRTTIDRSRLRMRYEGKARPWLGEGVRIGSQKPGRLQTEWRPLRGRHHTGLRLKQRGMPGCTSAWGHTRTTEASPPSQNIVRQEQAPAMHGVRVVQLRHREREVHHTALVSRQPGWKQTEWYRGDARL
jgi:hypothetical protein